MTMKNLAALLPRLALKVRETVKMMKIVQLGWCVEPITANSLGNSSTRRMTVVYQLKVGILSSVSRSVSFVSVYERTTCLV